MNWISVKDSLPRLEQDVLVIARDKDPFLHQRDHFVAIDRIYFIFKNFLINESGKGFVTHWCKIPKYAELTFENVGSRSPDFLFSGTPEETV